MKKQNINALITGYYNGSLSSEEETYLVNFLKDNDTEDYSEIKTQLQVLESLSENDELLGDDFDMKVLDAINEPEVSKKNLFTISRILSGVAATALLLISIWVITNIADSKEIYGTVNDPQVAFAETKKVLQKVSKNVKKGVTPATSTIKKVDKNIEKTKEIKKASKAIDKIKEINRLNSPSLLLKSMTKVTVKYGKS